MAAREFQPKLAPTAQMPQFPLQSVVTFRLASTFKVRTLIVGGGLVQILLFTLLPTHWAIVPVLALSLNSVITTGLQLLSPKRNPFTKDVVPGRTTAQLPDERSGTFGSASASQPVVLFNLGSQCNHPLGLLAPGVKEVGERFEEMMQFLEKNREEYGLLGHSPWKCGDRDGENIFMETFYFKDVDSIHRMAHGPIHRKTWDWFYAGNKYSHIGIFHETFAVPAHSYETLYVNCAPTGMGRAAARCETKDGQKYVNALVSADTLTLKSQYARMGRNADGSEK